MKVQWKKYRYQSEDSVIVDNPNRNSAQFVWMLRRVKAVSLER